MKEKISNRLQLTFAFHITIITILAYILRNVDYNSQYNLLLAFYSLISIGLLILIKSLYESINAFWGNTYKALASANEIEEFRLKTLKHVLKLEEYKKKYPDTDDLEKYSPEEKLNQYIYNEYAECASHNSELNDNRSIRNHNAIKYLLYSMIPFILASMCFIAWDMDSSSPRKKLLIEYNGLETKMEKLSKQIEKTISREINSLNVKTNTNSLTVIEGKIESVLNILERKIKESMMTQDDPKKNTTSNETPPPPPAPEPPEPRDLIESQTPKPKAEGGN